ncbi:hypothetical protein Lsed01_02167 [Demequina sediminis]|uniref:CobQ/CobB/MinD/ParA nucleotide binding domain-containing protein n=1 Tax=Demequina sediminis TaxID=1930058 RepID=A0ABP9WIP4_9MICO
MAAVGVVVAVMGPEEARVVAEIEAHPGLAVVRRCADLAEAVGAAKAGLGAVVIVSDQPHLDGDALAAIRGAGVRVLGVASPDAARLASLGVPVPSGPLAEAVLAAIERPAPELIAPPALGGGVVVAVWGTGGAPGRTTVAVTLATEAARSGVSTLLVDLDTYGASVATAWGLADETPGVAAVVRAAARGEDPSAVLARHTVTVAPSLTVLTGLTRAARWPEITRAGLERLWPALRAAAELIVVDLAAPAEDGGPYAGTAPHRDTATVATLDEADTVIAVGGAEPHQLVRLVHALLDREGPPPVVAVNRIRASVAGARPEDAIAATLGRHAGITEVWPLPWDQRACDAAVRDGRTLTEVAPRSPLVRAIAAMGAAVLASARASRGVSVPMPD